MSKNYLLKKLITVIMLDNEDKVLKMTKNYFSSNEINVIIVKNITDAKYELKKNSIDCVIIDTTLYDNHSFEFIQNLKNHPKLQYIPFVILTSKGFLKDRIDGYKSGCSAYLSKPFDPIELKCIVENVVYQKNLLKQKLISNYFLAKRFRLSIVSKYKNSFKENPTLILTPKEELILNYLLKNKPIKIITENLKIHSRTLEKSVSKILDKTQTKNKRELQNLPWNIL